MTGRINAKQCRSRTFKRKRWYRDLIAVLATEGGTCRLCGGHFLHSSIDPRGLRLAHLAPISATGLPSSRDTCTLACRSCDHFMGDGDWTGYAPSLTDQPDLMWAPAEPVITQAMAGTRRRDWQWTGNGWRLKTRHRYRSAS